MIGVCSGAGHNHGEGVAGKPRKGVTSGSPVVSVGVEKSTDEAGGGLLRCHPTCGARGCG